jgi:hypothetical protein
LYRLVPEGDENAEEESLLPTWRARLLGAPKPAGVPEGLAVPILAVEPAGSAPAPVSLPRAGMLVKPGPLPWQPAKAEAVVELEPTAPKAESSSVWTRIGFWDLILTAVWLKATVILWVYAINNI